MGPSGSSSSVSRLMTDFIVNHVMAENRQYIRLEENVEHKKYTTVKISSFQEMLLEYGISELDPDYNIERMEMLSMYKYTVILEGEFMELDNLEKWIKINLGKNTVISLFYGKTGYNYGFSEYFFDDQQQAWEATKAIPNIYTLYPASYKPNHICKSDGYGKEVEYNAEDKDAINDFSIVIQ
jgi:hypothetical protein